MKGTREHYHSPRNVLLFTNDQSVKDEKPYNDVKSFEELCLALPATLQFAGSSGLGGPRHIVRRFFKLPDTRPQPGSVLWIWLTTE